MSEIEDVKMVLQELAKQTRELAAGLQNAAPPTKNSAGPGPSVLYLMEISQQLEKTCAAISALEL